MPFKLRKGCKCTDISFVVASAAAAYWAWCVLIRPSFQYILFNNLYTAYIVVNSSKNVLNIILKRITDIKILFCFFFNHTSILKIQKKTNSAETKDILTHIRSKSSVIVRKYSELLSYTVSLCCTLILN